MKRIILSITLFSFIFSGCNSTGGNDADNNTTGDASELLADEDDTTKVIGSAVYLLQKSETDTNMDGVADEKITYTYNSNNDKKMVQTVTIENGVETIDETVRYTYDTQNRLLTQATYDKDGKITDSFQAFYTGDYISKTIDSSTSSNSQRVYTMTYNADGNILTYEYEYEYDYGYSLNGYTHNQKTYNYNDSGKPTHTVYQDISEDGTKGAEVVISRHTYDDQGRLTTWQYDYDEDGIFDYSEYDVEYDANGNVIKYFYDDEDSVNNYSVFEYSAFGTVSKQADYDSNRNLLYEETNLFDGSGRVLSTKYDEDGDSIVDDEDTYTYDTQGNLIAESSYWKSSYSNTEYYYYYTYEYDSNGLLIGETYSENAQGIPESETWHTWSEVTK